MAHDGNGLSRLGLEVQIVQHGFARHVAKAHVTRLHIPLHLREHLRIGRVRQLLRLIQQGKNPLRRGQRGIDFVDDVSDFVDRAAEFAGVEHEGRNLLHAHAAQQIQGGSHHADEGQPQVVDHVDRGAGNHAQGIRIAIGIGGFVVDGAEILTDILFIGISEDGFLPGEHLLHIAVHLAVGRAAPGIERTGFFAHVTGKQHRQRQRYAQAQHHGR